MNLQIVCILVFAWVRSSLGAPAQDACGVKADIAFILDSSASIYYKDFNIQKEFVVNLVEQFDVGEDKVRVAAIQFARDPQEEFFFNTFKDKASVIARINAVKQSNGDATYTNKALDTIREDLFTSENGAREGVAKICILLSDGASTQRKLTQIAATAAKKDGITLLAVGVGNVNKQELMDLVSPPHEKNFFYVRQFKQLKDIAFQQTVGTQACKAAPTTTTSTTTTTTTTTTLPPTTTTVTESTTTEIESTTTTASATTPGMIRDRDKPEKKCQGKSADVMFVLDMSSSIWSVDFQKQLQFVSDVVDTFDIKSGKTKVGAIVFSDNATVVFDMNKYNSKEAVSAAIKGIKSEGGITNSHKALDIILDRSFSKEYGSRQSAAHICVLITDGRSSIPEYTREAAKKVHARGIYLFAIGVGNMTDVDELAQMASKPTEKYLFEVNGYNALPSIRDMLAIDVCEVPQGDQPPCAKDVQASLVFGLYNIGGTYRSQVGHFIKSVAKALDLSKCTLGMEETCGQAEFGPDSFESVEEFGAIVDASIAMQMKDLLVNVRRAFARGAANRVAVLFVSGDISDMKALEADANRLKSYATVVVVRVGKDTPSIEDLQTLVSYINSHVLSITDAFAVNQFLKLLCQI